MMRIKRKKSIIISLLLLRLFKQLPWSAYAYVIAFILFRLIMGDHVPGDRHNNYNHHNRLKKTNESPSFSLPEQRGIIKIKCFGCCGFRCRFEKGLQSIGIKSKSNWCYKAINITTAAHRCKLKIKVPAPYPYPCVGVGDRRRSASASGAGAVMKGLNFYLFYIIILPAYLNLRRAKEFDQIITFLYFYLCLKGISTRDFSGLLRELSSFSIEDDHRESEIPIPYRNLLMILKKSGLSNEPFWVIRVIGDCELGFRYDLAKGSPSPQTRHQTCWVHRAVNANGLDSMPQSVQPLTLVLTQKIIISHEIYLSPPKDEALKIFNKFTEIFEDKYTESTTPNLTISISPISIYIYTLTAYMSQGRNLRNLILTMAYNFDMFKWRNPMKMNMIDSTKPLLIVIKSIITNARTDFQYTALRQPSSISMHSKVSVSHQRYSSPLLFKPA